MWHWTHDKWQVTCDKWPVTCDIGCEVNIFSSFRLSSSNGLRAMMFLRFGGKGLVTKSIIDKAVCKKAPASSGLVNIEILKYK